MGTRGDKVGVGSVVLGIVMLAAGVPLLLPRLTPREASMAASPGETPEAPPAATPSTPVARKDPASPALRVEQARGTRGVTVQVASVAPAPAPLARFAKDALVPLTPDEEALLREEAVEDLSTLVTRTERAFQDASPETRAQHERRYLAALNLVAKLSPPPPADLDAKARDVDARFQRALADEQRKWARLSPEERARAHETFKEWFFQGEQTR